MFFFSGQHLQNNFLDQVLKIFTFCTEHLSIISLIHTLFRIKFLPPFFWLKLLGTVFFHFTKKDYLLKHVFFFHNLNLENCTNLKFVYTYTVARKEVCNRFKLIIHVIPR